MKKNQSFATILRLRRQHLNLRQCDVARACNLSPEEICQIESGKRLPELDRVPQLASALGLEVEELCRRALEERSPACYRALFHAAR